MNTPVDADDLELQSHGGESQQLPVPLGSYL